MPPRSHTHTGEMDALTATRPIWRGHLRLALVSCPIALHATMRANGERHFHFVNPRTGHRVPMVTLDSETDKVTAHHDLVTGCEFAKNRYRLPDGEDFAQARIETSPTMAVGKFVDPRSIDPIWCDTSHHVTPDGAAGEDVIVVLRDALRDGGRAALSRLVMAQRERTVAIPAMGAGMVCHTSHAPRELYDAKSLFGTIPAQAPDAAMVRLAGPLTKRQTEAFAPESTEDRYDTRRREVIDARLRGKDITPHATEEPSRDDETDLMASLNASLNPTKSARPARSR